MFKYKTIDHIGICVKDLNETLKFFNSFFGIASDPPKFLESMHIKKAFIKIGNTKLEFFESLDSKSKIAKYLGTDFLKFHHICLLVDNIDEASNDLKSKGIKLIDEKAKMHDSTKIAFIHPKSTMGLLLELKQEAGSRKQEAGSRNLE